MQFLVTGVDETGGSCIVSRDPVNEGEDNPGLSLVDTLLATTESPPPSRPAAKSDFHDLEIGPGLVRWAVLDFEPGASFPMHHTDTIDCDTVLSGSMELTLEDGKHVLNPGDCVLVNGVDHAWRAGPNGCRMSFVVIGTPAPD